MFINFYIDADPSLLENEERLKIDTEEKFSKIKENIDKSREDRRIRNNKARKPR